MQNGFYARRQLSRLVRFRVVGSRWRAHGLKRFGSWPTSIALGSLAQLCVKVGCIRSVLFRSHFRFFATGVCKTSTHPARHRWQYGNRATAVLRYDADVHVTCRLPGQLRIAQENLHKAGLATAQLPKADCSVQTQACRAIRLLDDQFLDCFSEAQIVAIRAGAFHTNRARPIYILEPFWIGSDSQPRILSEQTSLYSRHSQRQQQMYDSRVLTLIEQAG